MVRKIIHDGPINTAVKAWMRGQGINPEDVRGYTLAYDAGDLMTIDIRMYVEDVAPAPKSTNRPFVVDDSGHVWAYDAPRDGYRFMVGGGVYSLDYIRERYGIAEVQPPHATCQNVTSPSDSAPTWVCGAACPKVWPARVRGAEGEEFRHQGDGVYRLWYSGLCEATYTLEEIERDYGPITVIESSPKRVRDTEGDEFRRQDDGTYRLVLNTGDLGDNPFTLREIERPGPITVIEA